MNIRATRFQPVNHQAHSRSRHAERFGASQSPAERVSIRPIPIPKLLEAANTDSTTSSESTTSSTTDSTSSSTSSSTESTSSTSTESTESSSSSTTSSEETSSSGTVVSDDTVYPGPGSASVLQVSENWMNAYDKDGDGKIEKNLYINLFSSRGDLGSLSTRRAIGAKLFENLDQDNNGTLDQAEITACFKAYIASGMNATQYAIQLGKGNTEVMAHLEANLD